MDIANRNIEFGSGPWILAQFGVGLRIHGYGIGTYGINIIYKKIVLKEKNSSSLEIGTDFHLFITVSVSPRDCHEIICSILAWSIVNGMKTAQSEPASSTR